MCICMGCKYFPGLVKNIILRQDVYTCLTQSSPLLLKSHRPDPVNISVITPNGQFKGGKFSSPTRRTVPIFAEELDVL